MAISLEEGTDWKEIASVTQQSTESHKAAAEEVEDNNDKCCNNVRRDLVAPKLFYFLFFGANGTLMPYLILFFKQLGLSPSQVGIVSGLKPFISFVCSPLWGFIADKSNKTLLIYIISMIAYAGGYLAYSFTPSGHVCKIQRNLTALHKSHFPAPFSKLKAKLHLRKRDVRNLSTRETELFAAQYRRVPDLVDKSVIGDSRKLKEESAIVHPDPYKHQYLPEMETSLFQVPPTLDFLHPAESDETFASDTQNIPEYDSAVEITDVTPEEQEHSWAGAVRSGGSPWSVCAAAKANAVTNLETVNGVEFDLQSIFRYLLAVTIFATIFSCPLITIVDTSTIRILKRTKETQKYGKQRLWGSLGWGLAAFGVGSFIATVALCPGQNDEVSYYPAFYVFTGLQFLALLVGLKLDFKSEEQRTDTMSRTEKISQGLSLLTQPIYLFFIITSFYIGIVMSIIKTFLFWHLKDIGGTQMLFSTVAAINCTAEVFVYFFSATFIEKMGHIKVLYIALVCYSLRLFYYGLLPNPWYVLAAEPLSGITTAAAWASMTSYVGIHANNESVTTLQGILHGVHWGLGHGVGELIGGFMVSWIGAAMTFNIFGAITIVQLLLFMLVIHKFTPKCEEVNCEQGECKKEEDKTTNQKEEIAKEQTENLEECKNEQFENDKVIENKNNLSEDKNDVDHCLEKCSSEGENIENLQEIKN